MLVQDLPSRGYGYTFNDIKVTPMNYGQILEYLDNVPNNELDKFYFDYRVCLQDDPNIENLLFPDFEFIRFYKKVITISKNLEFTTQLRCKDCGTLFAHKIKLSDIKFQPLDKMLIEGCAIELGGTQYPVKLPTMAEFLKVFNTYKKYKKTADFRLIKLIAMFEDAVRYPNQFESLVVTAKYDDIVALTMLYDLYYELIEPVEVFCPKCNEGVEKLEDLRGMVVEIHSLTTDFFRDILINNRLDKSKVLLGKIHRSSGN